MKVAFITGAGRGLGRAVAVAFAEQGYALTIFSRSEAALRETEKLIRKARADVKLFVATGDVREPKLVQQAVSESMRQFGRIDVLVNNAAIYLPGSVDLPPEEFSEQISINLVGSFNVLHTVVPIMKKQKSGYIFNVSSRAGKIGFAGVGAYCATKFGLNGLSESLYRELASEGIRVTSLCPSWIDTEMAQRGGTPLAHEEMIQPQDLASTMQWLLQLSPACGVREVVIECRRDIA